MYPSTSAVPEPSKLHVNALQAYVNVATGSILVTVTVVVRTATAPPLSQTPSVAVKVPVAYV